MSNEIKAYRQCVLDALGRMAAIEEDLRDRNERDGIDELEAFHEHGAAVLREAIEAIRAIPRV